MTGVPSRETGERKQIAFMECRDKRCKGTGDKFNDSGNHEWFVYEGDPESAWDCPLCGKPGTRYPY